MSVARRVLASGARSVSRPIPSFVNRSVRFFSPESLMAGMTALDRKPRSKTDAELGMSVHRHLVALDIETPCVLENGRFRQFSHQEQISGIAERFAEIMELLGLDLKDDSLSDTPHRVAHMYVDELFWGLDPRLFPKITTVENRIDYDEMVVQRGIPVSSHCEHHFVRIAGLAHVGYIPRGHVMGLSKMNRLVQYFCRRPQIQERLTAQICAALQFVLHTEHVAVVIRAEHHCVSSRGVEHQGALTTSSQLSGFFKDDPKTRAEFLQHINAQ